MTGRKRRQFARLRRQHNRSRIRTKRERNQVYGFVEIRRIVGQLSLPERIRDHACSLFRAAQEENLLRGRSLEGFASATVYAACRIAGVSRTRAEVLAVARADAGEHRAAYDALNRELGLAVGPVDPAEYVPRFASRLDLPASVRRRARDLARGAHADGLSNGKHPAGVAAACLYLAAKEAGLDLTQADAADVAGVTPVTLRSTYERLRDEPAD